MDNMTLYAFISEEEKVKIRSTKTSGDFCRHRYFDKVSIRLMVSFAIFLVFMILLGNFYPYNSVQIDSGYILSGPCAQHWLGTNQIGQDILAQLIRSIWLSLWIAFSSALLSALIGSMCGMICGYFGGLADLIVFRAVEIVSSIPPVLWVFVLNAVLPHGVGTMILILGICAWATTAVIVRGATQKLKNLDFIKAAKCKGVSSFGIIIKHIAPNCLPLIITQIVMLIPNAIFSETMLSYAGIGVQPPNSSLGKMLNQAVANISLAPYQLLVCALTILLIVGFFYVLGGRLKEAEARDG